jgi:hypothetical protein
MVAAPSHGCRFLFTTLGYIESEFYGRVGGELGRLGHDVAHLTVSRRAAHVLARQGFTAWCLPDEMDALGAQVDWEAEAARITSQYGLPELGELYRTDFVCVLVYQRAT